MIKESILFVVATGVLIYFVTPSEKSAEPDVDAQQAHKVAPKNTQPSDDGWGYEDETDDDTESFIFGEPLTGADGDDDKAVDEEYGSDRQEQSDSKATKSASVTKSRQKVTPGSPASNEEGSVDNPIIFKTSNPSNPVDD